MKIKKGNTVQVEYTGKLENGTIFDTNKGKDPLEFQAGSGQLIKGFDEAVIGMQKGQEKEIKIKPSEAYGEVNPDLLKEIPREQLPKEPEPKAGMTLVIGTPDGRRMPVKIVKVSAKNVTIDLNHPLAGKTLIFLIKIIDVKA